MVKNKSANKAPRKEAGQALVEYALIIALVAIAILGIIAITGPAVGNVFSNAVWNLVNQTVTPYNTLSPNELVGYLTAVASYTPPPRGQGATGTVGPTRTPIPSFTPVGTLTPTPTKTSTITPTMTSTGPTVTPVDKQFNTNNVYTVGDVTDWHYDTYTNVTAQDGPSRARMLWTVDYFNNTSWSGGPVATDTLNDHIRFNWGTGSPRTGVNPDNFGIRYTAKSFTDGLPTVPFTAGEMWQVRVTGNQFISVVIDGIQVAVINDAGADNIQTKVGYYAAGTTGRKSVFVYVYDGTGLAQADIAINRVADYGTCHWQTTASDYRSEYSAWADSAESPKQSYRPNGSCTLRQRGWYDLATVANPRLIFWNRWKLNTGDSLQVGIRRYGSTTDHWAWGYVQRAMGNNFNWNRQIIDLTKFPAVFDDATIGSTALGTQPTNAPVLTDYSGARIEIAFRVVTDGAGDVEDGWYIDDIGVFNWAPEAGDYPYQDEINTATRTDWVNECKWDIANDVASGRTFWTTGRYTSGSDCSLTLDRAITIPTAVEDPDLPLLEFDAKTKLDSIDQVRVEYALPTSDLMLPASWTSLPKIASSLTCPPATGFAIYCSTTDMAWENIKINLNAIRGQTVMFRFRLLADTSGDPPVASQPYSWSIDNVWIHGNNVTEVPLPFIEPFSTSSNWTLNGWSLTSGSDFTRSSPTALTDSPNGAQYTSTTNITTQLTPAVNIVGASDPIVSFYTRWQAPTANLQLDLSADEGLSWTPIWQFSRPTMGDENRAWERFEVRLADVPSVIIGSTSRVMFRFKMLATGSATVGDGFYIDDFRVEQAPLFMTKTLNAANNFTHTEALNTAPKGEAANPTDFEWHVGGEWSWQPTAGRDGTGGWTDSPGTGVNYNNPLRSILEYRSSINTTATQFPALVFWTKYNMMTAHAFAVDIKGDTGTWTQVWSNIDVTVATPTNLGWHRVVLPISSALTQPVRVRFRLTAMDSTAAGDGIYIDDVQFVDRAVWTDFNTVVPGFLTVADQNKWIREGDWKVPVTGVPINPTYGTLFGKPEVKISTLNTLTAATTDWGTPLGSTSQWATQYWHTNSATYWPATYGTRLTWTGGTGLLSTAPQVSQINPDLSLDVATDPTNLPIPPGVPAWGSALPKNDWYAIRYRRRFNGNGGTYLLRLNVTGGAEVLVGGTVISPNTGLVAPYVNSSGAGNVANTSPRTYYYTATIGTNTEIEVRFWHSTDAISGSAKIDFGIAEPRTVAKTSQFDQNYTHLTKTSLILDGYVTIPAGATGSVSYDERWSLAQVDYATAYYSLDRGATWIAVASTQHSTNSPNGNGVSNQDWITSTYLIPNVSGTPAKVMLKWELDSRTDTSVANGWLIDNVIFSISSGALNAPPTSSSLTATTVAGTATSNIVPTVTDPNMPLDYFNIAITSAPKRGAAVVTDVINNTDTVRYTPTGDWTGVDTMLYRVTDNGGLMISGQVATYTVNPKFNTGLDVGDATSGSVGTIDGNGWVGLTGSSISPTINGTTGSLASVTSSGSATKDNMLRDYIKATNAATGLRAHFGVPAGVYSVYLYWVQSEATAQTFDVYLQGGADVVSDGYKGNRVENDLTLGAQGTWVKTGPYTVRVTSSNDLVVRTVDGGIAALAGIELYQGGDHLNYTSADVSPVAVETVAGSTVLGAGTVAITAYGRDLWDTEDGFRYVYKAERGDVDFIAKIDSATLTSDGWAKAGLMFRSSLDANSANLFFGITPQSGTNSTVVQIRSTAGAATTSVSEYSRTLGSPIWLKVQKRGNTFDVFVSTDGTNFGTSLGTHTVSLGTSYLYGLAVTAHSNGANSSASFSGITTILQ